MNYFPILLACLSLLLISCSSHSKSSHKEEIAPIKAQNDRVDTRQGQVVTINVLKNDQTPKTLPTIQSFSKPKHGHLKLSGLQFIYIPNPLFHGKDHFFYQLSDTEGRLSTAHVSITVVSNETKKTKEIDKPASQTTITTAKTATKITDLKPTPSQNSTKRNALKTNKPKNTQEPDIGFNFHPEDPIRNPYYSHTEWKLWFHDQKSVDGHKAVATFKRYYPVDQPADSGIFLSYSNAVIHSPYAGFWDDFYLNQDNNHSRMSNWDDKKGNQGLNLKHKLMWASTGTFDARNLKKWGVTYTSQSTTHMGHDIANRLSRMLETEKQYYFCNVLRTGPAHISFNDTNPKYTYSRYEALTPIMLNSIGSSGSEMNAISKLLLASGYFPKATKYKLKQHGLYTSTLLYLWKASLPFNVPYENELRHRPAYTTGPVIDSYNNAHNALMYIKYDESQHLKNMINMAKTMTVTPPIALIKKLEIQGGKVIYDQLKTTWLIHQNQETVTLKVSVEESYDLQDLPLSYHWTVLYGDKNTQIKKLTPLDYQITIPFDEKLPKGRTVIMLTTNNGQYDSNPAIINIYRENGKINLRPSLEGLSDITAKPGETVSFDIKSIDPEGFETVLYQWDNQVGKINGKRFTWQIPPDTPPGKYPVTLISSDGTTGTSYEAKRIIITVIDTQTDTE